MNRLSICKGCLEKQRAIDQLTEENRRLKEQLHYRQRKTEEGPFGSATPSAKIPIKSDNESRLYHWVTNRKVPADNNRAERELRLTVIARKVSFGSQSDAGAKTREILMTLLHTLKKRFIDPQAHFKSVLDRLATNPTLDMLALLFSNDTS